MRLAAGREHIICSGKFSLWLIHLIKARVYPQKKILALLFMELNYCSSCMAGGL